MGQQKSPAVCSWFNQPFIVSASSILKNKSDPMHRSFSYLRGILVFLLEKVSGLNEAEKESLMKKSFMEIFRRFEHEGFVLVVTTQGGCLSSVFALRKTGALELTLRAYTSVPLQMIPSYGFSGNHVAVARFISDSGYKFLVDPVFEAGKRRSIKEIKELFGVK